MSELQKLGNSIVLQPMWQFAHFIHTCKTCHDRIAEMPAHPSDIHLGQMMPHFKESSNIAVVRRIDE
jgi:hypothetical protein